MAKANITQYSATPSSNADINDINIAENCPASGLNNAIRELMAHLKNVDTGTQALTALSVAGSVTATTSLKTPLIEFTDGDNALTIADGGNVTANANLTVSGASTFNGNVELSATSPVLTVTATDTNQGSILFKEGSTSKFNLSVVGSSDVFQIYNYNTSSQSMVIDANGHITMPKQPAFLIKASGGQQNIAINTMTEVQWNGTEVFDQNLDFASHTFTAPVTGKYQFNAHMYLNSLDTGASYYQVQITTSNRNYPEVFTPNFSSDPTYWSFTLNMLTDMDASDTATISVYQSSGTAQLDVDGGSYFSGYLVC